jgi:hypothetical protein
MTVEGITRVKRRGALVLDNNTVYDTSISYTALGVLAVLLARPDEAPKGYRTLKRPEAGVGQDSILSAFRELRAGGYRYQFLRPETTPKGNRVFTDTYIYDTPVTLEMAKQDHFSATGKVAIEAPDRRKSKGTLARVTGAQASGAQASGAQDPGAQNPGGASGEFSGSPKNVEQINQKPENDEKPTEELPAQPTATPGDDATKPRPFMGITPEQMERNKAGAAAARAALRAQASSTEAKDVK